MKQCLVAAALLTLSACGNPTAKSDDPIPEPAPTDTPMPVEPDGGIGDGAGPPGDAEAIASNTIPVRFHGAWDYEGGTCDDASDMRMEISGSEILFYESIGQVTAVKAEGDDIVATLDMEGEGETWKQSTRLSLRGSGDGERLHSSDGELPKKEDEYPSKRCPV
ncbi:hypothetical protein ACI5KX_04345 [Erythrobacter sp. GH1-10]|uniref:hypothetical protein n=1 Tax=Erythrobacter sp. GH1-10 TaxID=3349334 RepID=UPI00387829DE